MPAITAIVLSARPVTLEIPGVEVLSSVQEISSVAQLYGVRLDVLRRVNTEFCFYLDDDDELPPDYLSVLDECVGHGLALAYTDELVRYRGSEAVRKSAPYDLALHKRSPMLVHHLALMRTADAARAARRMPAQGSLSVEQPLYMELAKGGAAYVPRIGYVWNRSPAGISHWPRMLGAQIASQRWCNGAAT